MRRTKATDEIPDFDNDMDRRIRTGVRAGLTGAVSALRPGQTQPSIFLRIMAKILEEPYGVVRRVKLQDAKKSTTFRTGVLKNRNAASKRAGVRELWKVAFETATEIYLGKKMGSTYTGLQKTVERKLYNSENAARKSAGNPRTSDEKWAARNVLPGKRREHVTKGDWATYVPNSEQAAHWLLQRLQLGISQGRVMERMLSKLKSTDTTPFTTERRKLNTLYRQDAVGTHYFSYIMPIIKAHGLADQVPQKYRQWL